MQVKLCKTELFSIKELYENLTRVVRNLLAKIQIFEANDLSAIKILFLRNQ